MSKKNYYNILLSGQCKDFFDKFHSILLQNSYKKMVVPEHILFKKLKKEFDEVLNTENDKEYEHELVDLSIMCLLCFMRNRGYRDE